MAAKVSSFSSLSEGVGDLHNPNLLHPTQNHPMDSQHWLPHDSINGNKAGKVLKVLTARSYAFFALPCQTNSVAPGSSICLCITPSCYQSRLVRLDELARIQAAHGHRQDCLPTIHHPLLAASSWEPPFLELDSLVCEVRERKDSVGRTSTCPRLFSLAPDD